MANELALAGRSALITGGGSGIGLAGDESSWVTGQCLGVDGGHTLRRGPDVEHWARGLYGDEAIDGPA